MAGHNFGSEMEKAVRVGDCGFLAIDGGGSTATVSSANILASDASTIAIANLIGAFPEKTFVSTRDGRSSDMMYGFSNTNQNKQLTVERPGRYLVDVSFNVSGPGNIGGEIDFYLAWRRGSSFGTVATDASASGMMAKQAATVRAFDILTGRAQYGIGSGTALAWQNPYAVKIVVTRFVLNITTQSSASETCNVGRADDATGTNATDTLIDGLALNTAAGAFDNIENQGTNGRSSLVIDEKGGTADYLYAANSGSATGLIAFAEWQYYGSGLAAKTPVRICTAVDLLAGDAIGILPFTPATNGFAGGTLTIADMRGYVKRVG